eukprot:PITA_14914
MNSIGLVLSLASSFKWEVHQMDVKYPFLRWDLHEEIYMEQPLGYIQIDSILVCRLKKSLYGLKQSRRAWNAKMDSFLLDTGFSRCHSDNTVYTKKVVDATLYHQLVGKKLYLTHSYPNLSFDVGLIARFIQNRHESHWKVAKIILCYIRGTSQFQIHYSVEASPLLVGFTNFDWADDPDDQKSTAGYLFTLGSGPITWACKKQSVISLSLVEAEYRGDIEASKEAMWLRQILSNFGFQQQHLTTLWCDNQSDIQLCKDLVQHQCRKHIEVHMHFIGKLIHDHVLEVKYFSTDDKVAYIFTKALTKAKFTKL